jgi:predicted glycosyltransferase
VHAVVLPRTAAQRDLVRSRDLPSLVIPDHAVDAQSLVALSDLVVSAGGTMNREAVALGVPVYTTFAGRIGAVDEGLVREGRLLSLQSAQDLPLAKRRATEWCQVGRDAASLLDLMVSLL